MGKYTLYDLFEGNFPVSQYFGNNRLYYIKFGLAGHEGVDWALPVGTKLLCPFDKGQILRAGWDNTYGWYMVIWDQKQKCAVWYCHMSKISVKVGQVVARGTTVGYSGNTGNVTGPHLHCNFVETDANGNRLNKLNGYQGFLNILDSRLVSWVLTR
mgnify:CR=1 FL=1